MTNLTEGPTHRTRFFLALGRKDAYLLNPEDVAADHKCKETENAIQNTLRIMREALPYT